MNHKSFQNFAPLAFLLLDVFSAAHESNRALNPTEAIDVGQPVFLASKDALELLLQDDSDQFAGNAKTLMMKLRVNIGDIRDDVLLDQEVEIKKYVSMRLRYYDLVAKLTPAYYHSIEFSLSTRGNEGAFPSSLM